MSPNTKILVFSMHSNKDYMLKAIKAGAKGYVLKNCSLDELINAIQTVHRGDTSFGPEITKILVEEVIDQNRKPKKRGYSALSPREQEVLILIAQGNSNKEIAKKLGVRVRTVEAHREHIRCKLDIHATAGLTKYAIEKKLVAI